MLNTEMIENHIANERVDDLLAAVVDNGMPLPLPLQVKLGRTSSVALALRSLIDISGEMSPLVGDMAEILLFVQEEGGSFSNDPLATATAAAALDRVTKHRTARSHDPIEQAHDRAIAALSSFQRHDALFECAADRTLEDRELTSAFVLYLLADDERFRATNRFAELMGWFEQRYHKLDSATHDLWEMARLKSAMHVDSNDVRLWDVGSDDAIQCDPDAPGNEDHDWNPADQPLFALAS